MSDSDDTLRQHIAKMQTIHGDEPIRVKLALPWAQELLDARATIAQLREEKAEDAAWLTRLREQLEEAREKFRIATAWVMK